MSILIEGFNSDEVIQLDHSRLDGVAPKINPIVRIRIVDSRDNVSSIEVDAADLVNSILSLVDFHISEKKGNGRYLPFATKMDALLEAWKHNGHDK